MLKFSELPLEQQLEYKKLILTFIGLHEIFGDNFWKNFFAGMTSLNDEHINHRL